MADIPQVLATYDALVGVALGASLTYGFAALNRSRSARSRTTTNRPRWVDVRLAGPAPLKLPRRPRRRRYRPQPSWAIRNRSRPWRDAVRNRSQRRPPRRAAILRPPLMDAFLTWPLRRRRCHGRLSHPQFAFVCLRYWRKQSKAYAQLEVSEAGSLTKDARACWMTRDDLWPETGPCRRNGPWSAERLQRRLAAHGPRRRSSATGCGRLPAPRAAPWSPNALPQARAVVLGVRRARGGVRGRPAPGGGAGDHGPGRGRGWLHCGWLDVSVLRWSCLPGTSPPG
jgi:hypothetical protein